MRNPTKYTLQETVGWKEFEELCVNFLFCKGYKRIQKAGNVRDEGRDAVTLVDKKQKEVYQFSKEKSPLDTKKSKFWREYGRWKGSKEVEKFVFVSNQDLGSNKIDLMRELCRPGCEIYDITDLGNFLDYDKKGVEIKRNYAIFDKDLQEVFGADDRIGKLSEVGEVVGKDEDYEIITVLGEKPSVNAKGAVFRVSGGKAAQFYFPKSKEHFEKSKPQGSFKLVFPKNTEEGHRVYEKYKDMVEKGDRVSIPPEYVKDFELRLGKRRPWNFEGKAVSVTLGPAKADKTLKHILRSTSNPDVSLEIDLFVTKSGTEEATLSNHSAHPPLDVKLVLSFGDRKMRLYYKFHPERCKDAKMARTHVVFLKELNDSGAHLILDDDGISHTVANLPPIRTFSCGESFINVLEKMVVIQDFFKVRLPNPLVEELADSDLWSILKLYEIADTGETKVDIKTLSFSLLGEDVKDKKELQGDEEPFAMVFGLTEGMRLFSILGVASFPNMEIVVPKAKIVNRREEGDNITFEIEVLTGATIKYSRQ